MDGTVRLQSQSLTCVVRLWSFGMGRMGLLSLSPVITLGSFAVGWQQDLSVVVRSAVIGCGAIFGLVALRVAFLPFLWLEQGEVGGRISCCYRGVGLRRRGPADLQSVTMNDLWATFRTDTFVIRSPFLSFNYGAKSWGLIPSKSAERTAVLCRWTANSTHVDLRLLDA